MSASPDGASGGRALPTQRGGRFLCALAALVLFHSARPSVLFLASPPPLASPTLPRLSEPAAILSRAALRLAQIRLAIGVAHLVAAASSDTGAAYKRADSSAGPYKCSRAAARGATGAALSTRSGGQSQSKSRSRS